MKEQAFIIGVSASLEEIKRLGQALGFSISGHLVQKSDKPHPDSYLGPGQLARLAMLTRDSDVIIADDPLSPRQMRTLEKASGKMVLDRTTIILRLFAARARSHAGRMQVDLAQAEYDLSRLRGRWTHLERQGGGRNKGAGEKQSEDDRRQLNKQISLLRRRISELERQRASQRLARERAGLLRVALVGYTNAGKSSLLAALTDSKTAASPRPFETLDPLTRRLDTARGPILISDTVGFISQLPTELIAAFEATLDEVRGADLILHVADASDPGWQENRDVVLSTLSQLGVDNTPRLDIFTHIDCAPSPPQLVGAHYLSSLSGQGVKDLRQYLVQYRDSLLEEVDLIISFDDGQVLSSIARYDGELVISQCEQGFRVQAQLPRPLLNKLLRTVPATNNTISY